MMAPSSAEWAWNMVEQAQHGPADDYKMLAIKLPSLLQASGLGQTLAFLYARSARSERSAAGLMFQQLQDRLAPLLLRPDVERDKATQRDSVMQAVVSATPARYRRAAEQLRQDAGWLKRFAEGRR